MKHRDSIWTDGRSGPAGRAAGGIALAHLTRSVGRIARRKGTTFTSGAALYIGRVCATDKYLVPPEVHWSTFAPLQHRQAVAEARASGKRLEYLFVTAKPGGANISYWLVPGDLTAAALAGKPPRPSDGLVFVRIHEDGGRSFLYETEVTEYRHDVPLRPTEQKALREAFGARGVTRPAAAPATRDLPNGARIETVSFARRGRITLPQWLRERFEITDGTRALVYAEKDRIVLSPVAPGGYRAARGSLRGKRALETLAEERRREREM